MEFELNQGDCDNQSFCKSIIDVTILPQTQSCISFFENRVSGSRTGDWARPRVANREALYQGIMLDTDTN